MKTEDVSRRWETDSWEGDALDVLRIKEKPAEPKGLGTENTHQSSVGLCDSDDKLEEW
jgi:hypothetical protein